MHTHYKFPWKLIAIASVIILASGVWRPVLAAFGHRPVARPFMASPITHTTYADFTGCVDTNTAHITDLDATDGTGGTITLAANFADDFPGSTLDGTKWDAFLWAGGSYTPNIANSLVTIAGNNHAFLRSTTTYTYGVMEFTAEFSNGAFQHIGFARDDFGTNRYYIVSTKTGDGNLYMRANNSGSEQFFSLGAVTGLHRYRIEWANFNATEDLITFYMDGVNKVAYNVLHDGTNGENFQVYISNDGSTPLADLKVDYIQAAPTYKTTGEFISCILDAQAGNVWDNITWVENKPANTDVVVQVSTSDDGSTFGAFTNATSGVSFGGQLHRYLKYKLILSTSNTSVSPRVDSVSLNDVVETPTPTSTNTNTPTPTDTPTATPTNTPTATFTPTNTPTNTPGPSPTPTPLPAATMHFPSSGNTPPGTRPLFDWANISGATSYTFQIATNANFTALVVSVNTTASAYTPMVDLPRNTLLYWRVRGNANGKPGLWSRTRYFYSANPPGVPMLLSPANNANTTTLKPRLDWGDSLPAATYYEVQISRDANFGLLLGRGQGGVTQLSEYTVETELITLTQYHWRVRAVNVNGGMAQVSQWSAVYSFRTP